MLPLHKVTFEEPPQIYTQNVFLDILKHLFTKNYSNVIHYNFPLEDYLMCFSLPNNCKIKNFLYTQFRKMIFLLTVHKVNFIAPARKTNPFFDLRGEIQNTLWPVSRNIIFPTYLVKIVLSPTVLRRENGWFHNCCYFPVSSGFICLYSVPPRCVITGPFQKMSTTNNHSPIGAVESVNRGAYSHKAHKTHNYFQEGNNTM